MSKFTYNDMVHKSLLPKVFVLVAFLTFAFAANAASSDGDVNNDGEINIMDVDAIINVILGSGNNTAADVNKDGEINILDVDGVINVILGIHSPQDSHEYVDLGLPSGTLWATMNVGATRPEEFGDYFAWGETEPKEEYTSENYKWGAGEDLYTKYCTDSSYGYNGFVDNKTELDLEDDAAYVNWGSSWRMPTAEQAMELMDNCTWQCLERNGVYGLLLTGPNGNTLFSPMYDCGWWENGGWEEEDWFWIASWYCSFRTRTLETSSLAFDIRYYYSYVDPLDPFEPHVYVMGSERYGGCTVRAVRVP